MSSRDDNENLALRKELLLARSSLYRLKIRQESHVLRQSLSWRGVGAAVAGSSPGRDALFVLAAEGLGRYRVARWLSLALRALAIARLTSLAVGLLRKPAASPADAADNRAP